MLRRYGFSLFLLCLSTVGQAQERAQGGWGACFLTAERISATASELAKGKSVQEVHANIDIGLAKVPGEQAKAHAALDEMAAAKPASFDAYREQKVEDCLKTVDPPARKGMAGLCYKLTLFAKTFFQARAGGASLERAKIVIRDTGPNDSPDVLNKLDQIAEAVYQWEKPELLLRAQYFHYCARDVAPPAP